MRDIASIAVRVVLAGCVLAAAGCGRGGGARDGDDAAAKAAPRAPLDILLITIDTLRHDHLACYGHSGVKTPALDRLAREGELYVDAITPQPKTAPAHASILTGLTPGAHGLRRNGDVLGESHVTLAEIYRERGYETAAFIGGFPLTRAFGFSQGFDIFQDALLHGETSGGEPGGKRENFAPEVADSMIAWLRSREAGRRSATGDRPFFAWVHFFDPHAPYEAPAPLTRAYYTGDERDPRHTSLAGAEIPNYVRPHLAGVTDLAYPIALYDAEITLVDLSIERMLAALADAGLMERTLVVVTADHGESLSEHGYYFCHRDIVYEDNVRVPLIVRWPRAAAGESDAPRGIRDRVVSTSDLFAMIRDAQEAARSLGAPRGGDAVFTQQHVYKAGPRGGERYVAGRYAARTPDRKLIITTDGGAELYDLLADPKELANLAASDSAAAGELRARLAAWIRSEMAPTVAAELDPEVIETLRSLGYVDH